MRVVLVLGLVVAASVRTWTSWTVPLANALNEGQRYMALGHGFDARRTHSRVVLVLRARIGPRKMPVARDAVADVTKPPTVRLAAV